tara:strand:- start:883 stop:1266 length:384 start_codon:yes stop_codon:yes gene_type:complete
MNNILIFPKKEKRTKPLPRQRVFYIGFRYVGPFLCQDVQNLYLKRKGMINGIRYWSIITYGKYDEDDYKTYSIQLDECEENIIFEMLRKYELSDMISLDDLEDMGCKIKTQSLENVIKISDKTLIIK